MQASKADFPIDFKFESFSKVIIERDWQSLNALSPINSTLAGISNSAIDLGNVAWVTSFNFEPLSKITRFN